MPETMTPAQQKIAESLSKSREKRAAQRKAREAAEEITTREKKFERARAIGEKYAPKFAGTKTRYQPPLANYTMESGWIPDPREQSAPNFNDGLASVALRWKGTQIVMDRWKPPRAGTVIDKRMRTKYAACAALGLSYWCDGFNGVVVTVDEYRRFVAIDIDHKRSEVRFVGTTRSFSFTVGDTDATLDLLAFDPVSGRELNPRLSLNYSGPLHEAETPKEIDRLSVQTAIAGIAHDTSYVTDLDIAVLQRIVDKAKYFNGARDIVPLVTAEIERRAAA